MPQVSFFKSLHISADIKQAGSSVMGYQNASLNLKVTFQLSSSLNKKI